MEDNTVQTIDSETFKLLIHCVRGYKVMFDADLAAIYGYSTKDFNRQVKNNREKFDADFMFQLTDEEVANLRCKNSTSSWGRLSQNRNWQMSCSTLESLPLGEAGSY